MVRMQRHTRIIYTFIAHLFTLNELKQTLWRRTTYCPICYSLSRDQKLFTVQIWWGEVQFQFLQKLFGTLILPNRFNGYWVGPREGEGQCEGREGRQSERGGRAKRGQLCPTRDGRLAVPLSCIIAVNGIPSHSVYNYNYNYNNNNKWQNPTICITTVHTKENKLWIVVS